MMLRFAAAACVLAATAPSLHAAGRPLKIDDMFALHDVSELALSPDGTRIAYTVTKTDAKKDDTDSDIYMIPFAGGAPVRITTSEQSEEHPRWSPDGKWLAFLSDRDDDKAQVYVMPTSGGEGQKLTNLKGRVSSFQWSHDSTRLLVVARDPDPDDDDDAASAASKTTDAEDRTPKPIVITRRQFKMDGTGYLSDRRSHLWVFDLASKSAFQLTSGNFDDGNPDWSPDGRSVAFASNRTTDPDANKNTDIFVIDAYPGAKPKAVVSSPGEDDAPKFSPDGKSIAYLAGGDPKDMWYGSNHLAVVPAGGGESRALTAALDRNLLEPRWSPDGASLYFIIEEGGIQSLGKVAAGGGDGGIERIVKGERDVVDFVVGRKGEIVFVESTAQMPQEISALDGTAVRRITHENDAVLANIQLAEVRRLPAKSADGTAVDGFIYLPPGYKAGEKVAAILRPHGGPTGQYSASFDFFHQVLAAAGYAVIAPNPRGSTGYGTAFARAIFADWGNKDFEDEMAAVDAAVAAGYVDANRLGVGGWSYGGIMTDYIVTKSTRFKAAVSGASMALMTSGYGTDHYQYEWETELGLPWKSEATWRKVSSSFFDVEKIVTPILYMGGSKDVNVPVLASEQLYQAVKRIGKVDTELVVYPGQYHGITTPSYEKDRLERNVAWYDKYLRPGKAAAAAKDDAKKPEATSLLGVPLFPPDVDAETREPLEANLAAAQAEFVKNPDSADNIIWLGRRLAYLYRFREAIDVYTRGIAKFPEDIRMYRHRGHRYITLREFDKAIADLDKAAAIIVKKKLPDAMEPDGSPNARGVPTSTSHFNIYYHLGLAHYLKGEWAAAEKAYRECMKYSKQDDSKVATSDWLYMTLRRAGKEAEAKQVLEPITAGMDVIESTQYRDRLLMYKGEKKPEDLLGEGGGDGVSIATFGYGVGNWYLVNGDKDKARDVFRRVVSGPQWAAFGFIASEVELARMK